MGWKTVSRVWLAAASALFLAGCAGGGNSTQFIDSALKTDPTAGFTHRVANSEVVLDWSCTRSEPGLLRVEGVVQNYWSAQPIKFMEFDLVGVDGDRQVSTTSAALKAILLFSNEVSPFRLDLKPAGSETRFDLYYQYRFNEPFKVGGRGIGFDLQDQYRLNDGRNDHLFAGPPGAGTRLLAQTLRIWLVRDACSGTQHLR
ncbi:MAG TPA: hypothetical protein VLG48_02665 [Candidatus Methylomirabilis sp.]|nr:hypothetical protein [Candidatus Methylomirabilis sp.]